MSPMAFDLELPPPPPPVTLSEQAIDRLRGAAGWARFLAILGFVMCGILVLAAIGLLWVFFGMNARVPLGNGEMVLIFMPLTICLLAGFSGAALLWGYGGNITAFLQRGEPALTRSFRSLRYFLVLWTLTYVLSVLVSALTTFWKLFR
jgi:hypothetical protein